MADASNSTSDKTGSFNRTYLILLVGLILLVLGLYLFFASTRQPHGKVSGAGTQKGMIATCRTTAV